MDQLEGVLSEMPVGNVELDTAGLVDRSVSVEQPREQRAPLPLGAAEVDLRDVLVTEDSHAAQNRVHRAVVTVASLTPYAGHEQNTAHDARTGGGLRAREP